jgi:hypothetical protein
MKHEGTVALFQYWDRLRDGRPAPRRTEIEPADIRNLLADTFIIETDARKEPVFRLAGTRLCAIFGRELKGFAFPSLWAQRDQRVVARLLSGALHQHSVAVIEFEGTSRSGRTLPLEMIALPLEGSAESPRALGSVTALERPYWLGVDPIVECRIESLRAIDPDREPMYLRNRPALTVPPLAADPVSIAGSGSGRRVRHLVVLEGGRGL